MERINNKNGIEMYYQTCGTDTRLFIYDSNKKYFNDMYYDIYDNDSGEEDIGAILHTLEETTLENMCNFFGARKYDSLKEMADKEDLQTENLENNDYTNIFKVNDKKFYTWSW